LSREEYNLGTVEASERLLRDLYIDLRIKLSNWAAVTHQTAQARMGYIGQHLTSVVTGLRGGKSGARGYDLIHPDGSYSEIKTCSRVDQLGTCFTCGEPVASIEKVCKCGCEQIVRKDDSKWLIGIHHDDEFASILNPRFYYLFLVDFEKFADPTDIRASIWQVDPKLPGFALCMIDYYKNIRAASASKAPFNLWPYSLKFALMQPLLIYHSVIRSDNIIETKRFPGRDSPLQYPILLSKFARSELPVEVIHEVARKFGMNPFGPSMSKASMLALLDSHVQSQQVSISVLAPMVATLLYGPKVANHISQLPDTLLGYVKVPTP
jgi:hypothetical protein